MTTHIDTDRLLNAEKQRRALRHFMQTRKLKIYPWCKRAGVSEGTLRAFMSGQTTTLQASTLQKLAGAENVPLALLLGEHTLHPDSWDPSVIYDDARSLVREIVATFEKKYPAPERIDHITSEVLQIVANDPGHYLGASVVMYALERLEHRQ